MARLRATSWPLLLGAACALLLPLAAAWVLRRDPALLPSAMDETLLTPVVFAKQAAVGPMAPSLEGGVAWLNTAGPIDLKALRGKFVVLDFWTYCCINCMHVLPELKKLEKAYPNNVVVIGVHSAKFDAEKDEQNIRDAIMRYGIEHPVINDANHVLWNKFGVNSWPSFRVIDPEGRLIAEQGGEVAFATFDAFIKQQLKKYRQKGVLNEQPLRFDLDAERAAPTALRYPSKIVADPEGERLFIADTSHNRIVVTDLNGKLLQTIGSGAEGKDNGGLEDSSFNKPHGMFLRGNILYVADTENHLVRRVDLARKRVTSIAGTGVQARGVPWPGLTPAVASAGGAATPGQFVGRPTATQIASPWDLWIDGKHLYIAMAGPHQIWWMKLDGKDLGPYAGSGAEDIVDGQLLPQRPYDPAFSAFAQPSGLASDGQFLYVADSEGSSIRAVPLNPAEPVRTVVGTAGFPGARLFTFGDVDGQGPGARLQHPLAVTYDDGRLYVADTYNNKIKVIDLATRVCQTLVGTGKPGKTDNPAAFDEPEGLALLGKKLYVADTNNHAIRVIDLADANRVSTLEIVGLKPPKPPASAAKPSFPLATEIQVPAVEVKPVDGKVQLAVKLILPKGYKPNPLAPIRYLIETEGEAGPVDAKAIGTLQKLEKPEKEFSLSVPVSGPGEAKLKVSLTYYYCETGNEGLCKIASGIWTVPVTIDESAAETAVPLEVTAP
ncbi:MAG: thioredoxin-like domain-containing protein [Pirellulales bacterium]